MRRAVKAQPEDFDRLGEVDLLLDEKQTREQVGQVDQVPQWRR
jgi:hypothetical protein